MEELNFVILALRRSFAKMTRIRSHFDKLNVKRTWRKWPGI